MQQYIDTLLQVMEYGTWHENRTGIRTKRISGRHVYFDCRQGFPIVTTKYVNFNAVKAELIGFLRGADSAAVFRELGTKIWDANANDNQDWLDSTYRKGKDDLGPIYGVQWRRWPTAGGYVDQLAGVLKQTYENPDSRRIIVSAWNPTEIPKMALPPCHIMWQLIPDKTTREMDLCVYLRSWDLFLGGPFNIASYGLLLELIARSMGYRARWLNVFAADVHIYENHLDQVRAQVERAPYPPPMLETQTPPFPKGSRHTGINQTEPNYEPSAALRWLTSTLEPDHIELRDYFYHPALKAPMAV